MCQMRYLNTQKCYWNHSYLCRYRDASWDLFADRPSTVGLFSSRMALNIYNNQWFHAVGLDHFTGWLPDK